MESPRWPVGVLGYFRSLYHLRGIVPTRLFAFNRQDGWNSRIYEMLTNYGSGECRKQKVGARYKRPLR